MISFIFSPHSLVQTKIKDMRFSTVFVFQNPYPFRHDNFSHRIIRVLDVAHLPDSEGTSLHTGSLHALADPVVAEGTFLGHLVDRMKKSYPVRTSHDAITAADAPGS